MFFTFPHICHGQHQLTGSHACMHAMQRATEIAAMEPRVAYYCRLYALKRVCTPEKTILLLLQEVVCSTCRHEMSSGSATPNSNVKRLFRIDVHQFLSCPVGIPLLSSSIHACTLCQPLVGCSWRGRLDCTTHHCVFLAHQALELPHPADPIKDLIKALFDQCEKDKPKIQPNEAADREYCKNFALTVFNRADKMDRANRADINTAKCFYAAAIFLQVMLASAMHDGTLQYSSSTFGQKHRLHYALKAQSGGLPGAPPVTCAAAHHSAGFWSPLVCAAAQGMS